MEVVERSGGVESSMRGMNVVALTGNVGSIKFSTTKTRGDEVCSFSLGIQKDRDTVVWTRVNVYGGAVQTCKEFLSKGMRVAVEGELMNRYSTTVDDMFTEVRCKDIKFIFDSRGKSNGECSRD